MLITEKVFRLTRIHTEPEPFAYLDKLVLMVLAWQSNDNGTFVSHKFLAVRCCCSLSAAVKTINNLIRLGLVIKTNRKDGESGGWSSNQYTINEEAIDALLAK